MYNGFKNRHYLVLPTAMTALCCLNTLTLRFPLSFYGQHNFQNPSHLESYKMAPKLLRYLVVMALFMSVKSQSAAIFGKLSHQLTASLKRDSNSVLENSPHSYDPRTKTISILCKLTTMSLTIILAITNFPLHRSNILSLQVVAKSRPLCNVQSVMLLLMFEHFDTSSIR